MTDERWFTAIALVVIALVIAALAAAGIHGRREWHRCVDNGGHFERVNCRQVEEQNCSTTDYGNGFVITSCMPTTSTVCDTVCRGARPEAGGAG